MPIAVETFVSWGPLGLDFIKEIGRKIKESTRDKNIISHDKEEPSLKVIFFAVSLNKNKFQFQIHTEGPCLMRLLVLGKNHISQIFALCNFWLFYFITAICLMRILVYFISLVQFFGYLWPENRSNEIKLAKNLIS